jgi:hypothetical protein
MTTPAPVISRSSALVVLAAMDHEFRSASEIAFRARMPWRHVLRILECFGSGGPVEHTFREKGVHLMMVWRKKP